jgi:hypothetical protein
MRHMNRTTAVITMVVFFGALATSGVFAETVTITLQQGVNEYEGGSDDNLQGGRMKLLDDEKRPFTQWHESQIRQGKAKREDILASLANYRHGLRWDNLDRWVIGENPKVKSAKVEIFYTDEFWSFYDYHVVLYRSLDGTKDNTENEPAAEAHILGQRRGQKIMTPFRSWVTFELKPEVVQAWIDDPKANQGLVLAMPEKTDPPGKKSTGGFVIFASNADGTPGLRPRMTITYEFAGNVPPFAPKLTQRFNGIRVGAEYMVRWSLPEKPDLNGDSVKINIQYGRKGGAWKDVARGIDSDAGAYLWKTEGIATGADYRLRLMAVDSSGSASQWTESDGLFQVTRDDVPFQLAIEPPLTKLRRDRAYRGKLGCKASIALAGNEYEDFQVIVSGVHRDVTGLHIVPGDLSGPGGATIPASRITVNAVGYVQTVPPKYSVAWVGLWPDPLLNVKAVDVPAGKVQPFWVTVYAPPGMRPGTYAGTLKIEGNGIAPQTVNVEVRVFGFDLSVRSTFRTMAIAGGPDRNFYGLKEGPDLDKLRETWYALLCAHRLPPGGYVMQAWSWNKPTWPVKVSENGSYDFDVARKWGKFCFERGMSTFVTAVFAKPGKWGFPEKYSEKYYADYTKFMTSYVAFLKENGWLAEAVAYNIDEAPPEQWQMCKENYRRTKAICPELSVFQCLNAPKGVAALEGFFDVVDINIGQYHQGAAPRLLKEGKRVWWCICCWPSGHPNLFVEYPAMDARIVGWLSWKLGVEGFEYWNVSAWSNCMKDMGEKKFVDQVESKWSANSFGQYNGDGYLCYLGPNNTLLSSIRFEALRDGFEDYEYLAVLKRRLEGKTGTAAEAARKLLDVPDAVCRTDLSFSNDPIALFETRRQVAEAIEKLAVDTDLNASVEDEVSSSRTSTN